MPAAARSGRQHVPDHDGEHEPLVGPL
jgi:hypothetical protein